MGERRTITVALNEPREGLDGKEYKPNKFLWNFALKGPLTEELKALPEHKKGQFVSFSKRLVEEFYKANLAGVEHEYVVQVEGGDKALGLLEIPGVYTPKSSENGWAKSGPLLSDRQVALLAAAISGGDLSVADLCVDWLAGGGAGSAGDGRRLAPAARRTEPTPPPAAAEEPLVTPVMLKTLRRLAEQKGILENKIANAYEVVSIERLTVAQANEAIGKLSDPPQSPPDTTGRTAPPSTGSDSAAPPVEAHA